MASVHTQADRDRMGWRWLAALVPLVMVVHEAHESAHTAVGRIVCGRWAERDFNRWSIEGCDSALPTLSGPLLSYGLMALGVVLARRLRWPGLALIFAANPLARMVTAAMGRGDEAVVARAWFGAEAWPSWLSGALVMLSGGMALWAAWRGLENVRARPRVFLCGAMAGIAVTGPLLPLLNRLLRMDLLAAPVAGAPWLVHGVTLLCLLAAVLSVRWLDNPPTRAAWRSSRRAHGAVTDVRFASEQGRAWRPAAGFWPRILATTTARKGRMFRFLRRTVLVLVLVALVLAVAVLDVATYDARAWQADYGRLKQDMAQGYANLDWIAAHRQLDLAALDRHTTAALEGAHSRVRAFLALRRFIRAFRDPHLRLVTGQRSTDEPHVPVAVASSSAGSLPASADVADTDPPAGEDCAAAGYEEGDHAFHFPFDQVRGWQAVGAGDFPTGLIGDLGVLRIAQFGEDRYAAVCRQVFRPGIGMRALQLAVREVAQRRLVEAIRALQARGARRLLVDVSGNGGGTEWVTEVVALLSDRLLSRAEPRLVASACDRSSVWSGAPAPCAVLAPEGERATLQGTGVWTGPVLILADRRTGSASEDFVAWLQQNRVARVLGETTVGAGCGYVNGGARTHLRASPFDVRMPNCARFLDDGTNEIEGIAPDIALPMTADAAVRAGALLAAVSPVQGR
jgi:hypothetical protein